MLKDHYRSHQHRVSKKKFYFFEKQNENLEDETNNAFVKFQRWVYSAGYENIEHSTLHLHAIPRSCQRFDLNNYSSELSFSYWR